MEDERLQCMRRTQVAAAKADYARHEEKLKYASKRVDITAEPVAYEHLKMEEIGDG